MQFCTCYFKTFTFIVNGNNAISTRCITAPNWIALAKWWSIGGYCFFCCCCCCCSIVLSQFYVDVNVGCFSGFCSLKIGHSNRDGTHERMEITSNFEIISKLIELKTANYYNREHIQLEHHFVTCHMQKRWVHHRNSV